MQGVLLLGAMDLAILHLKLKFRGRVQEKEHCNVHRNKSWTWLFFFCSLFLHTHINEKNCTCYQMLMLRLILTMQKVFPVNKRDSNIMLTRRLKTQCSPVQLYPVTGRLDTLTVEHWQLNTLTATPRLRNEIIAANFGRSDWYCLCPTLSWWFCHGPAWKGSWNHQRAVVVWTNETALSPLVYKVGNEANLTVFLL